MSRCLTNVQRPVSFGGRRYVGHRSGQSLPRSLSFCCPSSLLYPAEIYLLYLAEARAGRSL